MSRYAPASEAATKDERFNIRAKHNEKELVERAARATRMTTSQFVMQAALRSAEEVLGDQTRFVLPPDRWEAFLAALDRPTRTIPELKAAASKKSPFSER
ncbi:MAG: DUF1778 domain-containing protein [Coriobacteriia bacterium]